MGIDKIQIIGQFRQVQVLMHKIKFQGLKAHSPYNGQGRVLSVLKEQPQISQRELTARSDISKQALSALLKRMEGAGYITRMQSEADRRVQLICLTEAGRAAAENSDMGVSSLTGLLDCLSEEELDSLQNILNRIIESNSAMQPEPQNAASGGDHCLHCTGPENCTRDYLEFGHSRPDPDHCKFLQEILAKGKLNDQGREITES